MQYLTIRGKLTVAALLLFAAAALAVGLLASDKTDEIDVARKQRSGAVYLGALGDLHRQISERGRLRTPGVSGDALAAKSVEIDLAMSRLEQIDLRSGPSLDSTEDFVKLKKLWQQIKAADAAADVDVDAKFDPIFRSMVALVGDTSALTLDSVLDTYYLTQVAVVRLSNTTDRLNEVLRETRALRSGDPITQAVRDRLVVTSALLKADVNGVEGDLRVVTAFNPALQDPLEAPRQEFARSAREALAMIDRNAIQPNRLQAGSSAFAAALEPALSRNFKLHAAVIGLLDNLMLARIEAARSSRILSLASVAVVAIVGVVGLLWVGRSAFARLDGFRDAVEQTAAGQRQGPIAKGSSDEIGALVDAVNRLIVLDGAAAGSSTREAARAEAVEGRVADETVRLKLLVADLALENQALRMRN